MFLLLVAATITVTDSGPLTATNVVVTDTLPAGATFVSASPGCTVVCSAVRCVVWYQPARARDADQG
jgi:hypothetical protein